MKYAIALVALLCAGAAHAQIQSYTTMPLPGGMSVTDGPNGWSAMTTPLPGGMSVTDVMPGYSLPQVLPQFQPQPMQLLPPAPLRSLGGYR